MTDASGNVKALLLNWHYK